MMVPLVCAFVLWYLYFGLEYALNGGTLGRHPFLMVFQCFWEEVLWNIPGGLGRKTKYVRENVIGDSSGSVLGHTLTWNYHEVRSNNLFSACARDVLRGAWSFWATTIVVPTVGFFIGKWLF